MPAPERPTGWPHRLLPIELTADGQERSVSDPGPYLCGPLSARFCQPCLRHRIAHSDAVGGHPGSAATARRSADIAC